MVFRTALAAIWLVLIGLTCVYLEFARVKIGYRIHRNLLEVDAVRARLRSLEIEYSRLASPEVLDDEVEEFLRQDDVTVRPGA